MSGQIEPYDPYGGGGAHGGRGRYIRSRPVGLKTVAAITAAQWIGRRVATRLTPIFLLLLLMIGIPLAFWGDPALIICIGLGLSIITYAVNRHVPGSEAMARQWALRTTALPVVGTAWVMLWHEMHTHDMDVINEPMLLAYWLFGCLAWAWLYIAKFVGAKVAWERAQRDFGPVARRVGLAGAAIVKTTQTAVGTRKTIDVRGTGKTASALAKSGELAEQLAAAAGMAPGKVRVAPSATHAGHIEISEWLTNPWSKGVPHPLAPDFAMKRVDPIGPFVIGRDPETEKDLTIEIVNGDGGVHWVFIAGTRGGKTNLINNIVEHLTRARDAAGRPLVRITMIDILKGMKDAANWAPAVHRVYGGPKAVHGALSALQRAVDLIAERAELNGRRGRSKHIPTAEEPIELIIIDEASFLMTKRNPEGRRAIELVNGILKAGASELVIVIIASQRAVLEHLGSGDVKANAFGIAVLPVRRAIEQTNIIPDWRDRGMPDMSKFGDGAKGTVLVTLNDEWSAGRTFELHDVMTIRKISTSRVLPGNEGMITSGAVEAGSASAPAGPDARTDADALLREPPADGVDGPDAPDDLDFEADADEVLPPAAEGDIVPRLGDRTASRPAASGPVARPDPRDVESVRADGVHLSGSDAEDDEAADAAVQANVANVRPLRPAADEDDEAAIERMMREAAEAGEIDDEVLPDTEAGRTDGMDSLDKMSVQIDRALDVTAWAAARERGRTPGERAELVDAWRERTWQLDQGERLPDAVNACLSALAKARGDAGFTRSDAQVALASVEATDGRSSVAGYLRVLANQGHLERIRGAGPNGADVYRLGQRHRKRA